jgi:hypothetical protein
MGKRELLLILGFLAIGIVTYRLTVPPSSGPGVASSVGRLVDAFRREVAGDRIRASRQLTATEAGGPRLKEIHVPDLRGSLQISGEPRADVVADARVEVAGFDTADAERHLKDVVLELADSGEAVVASVRGVPRSARPRIDLHLRVPAGLGVRIGATQGRVEVSGVASAVLDTRGDTTLSGIPGSVTGTHRGGDLVIQRAGAVELTTRQADVRLERIADRLKLEMIAGEVVVRDSESPIQIDARRADVRIEGTRQPVAIEHGEGDVGIADARGPVRIAGRRGDTSVALLVPATVDIASMEGRVSVSLPARGGVRLEATAVRGSIRLEGTDLQVAGEEGVEQRATGLVGGDGPPVVIRVERGDILIRRTSTDNSSGVP